MYTDKSRMNFFQQFSQSPGQPRTFMQKLVATVVTVGVFALALMFSVVFFALILTLGLVAWGYLWWKSRDLRRQMREQQGRREEAEGLVIEGEVIREVDADDGPRGGHRP